MRWPSGAAVTLLFLVAAASAQRGSRRFSSSTDNNVAEEEITPRSHRFQTRHRETNEVAKSAIRADFPSRDAEVVQPTRSSARASYRSRNEVSSRDSTSQKEVPIESSGAVEYERLQSAEPTRKIIAARPTASVRAIEDSHRSSTRNQISNSHRRNPISQETLKRPNSRERNNFPSRGESDGRTKTVTGLQEETSPRSSYRSGSTRGGVRISSQTEIESPKNSETYRPTSRGRDDHRRLPDAETSTDLTGLVRNQDASRSSPRSQEVRGRTGGRSLQLEDDDNRGNVRSRVRSSSRGSADTIGRQTFKSRGSNAVSQTDEQETYRGSSRTPGRLTGRTESDSRGRAGLKSRAKYEDKPTEPITPSAPLRDEPPEDQPKFEEAHFASTAPPPEREIRTASPNSRGSAKGNSRGRGTARASSSDLRAGGLKEKVTDEVSDSDNYPEVYKQLKKSGTDPKDILVPKYKQIISKYSKSSKDDSRQNVGTGTISYKFPEFTPSSRVGSSTSTPLPAPVTTTKRTNNHYQTTRSTLARNPEKNIFSGFRDSDRKYNRKEAQDGFSGDTGDKLVIYSEVEATTRKTARKQAYKEHRTPIDDEILKTGKDARKNTFERSKASSDYYGQANIKENHGSVVSLTWPFDAHTGSHQISKATNKYNPENTVKTKPILAVNPELYDDISFELPKKKQPAVLDSWDDGVIHSESFTATKPGKRVNNIRSASTEKPFNNQAPVKNSRNIWSDVYDEGFSPIQPNFVQPKIKYPIASIKFDDPESGGYNLQHGGFYTEAHTPGYVFHDVGSSGFSNMNINSPNKRYENVWTTERIFVTPSRNFEYSQPERGHVSPNTPNPIHDSHVSVTFNQVGAGSWGVDYSLQNHRFHDFSPPKFRAMAERAIESDGKARNLYEANSYLAEKSRKFETPPSVEGNNQEINDRMAVNPPHAQEGFDDLKNSPSPGQVGIRGRSQGNSLVQNSPKHPKPKEPVVLSNPLKGYPKIPTGTEFDVSKSNAIFEQTIYGNDDRKTVTVKCVYCPTTPPSVDNIAYTVTLNGRTFHRVDNPKVEIDHKGTTKQFRATTPESLRNPSVEITPPFISRSKVTPKNDIKLGVTAKPTDRPQNVFGFWSPHDEVTIKTTTKPPTAKTTDAGNWNPYRGLRRSTTPTSTAITSLNSIKVTKKYEPTIYPINLKKTTTPNPGVRKAKGDDNQSNNILLNLVNIFRRFVGQGP